jgi:phosphoglycolate phosphatase
MSRYELLIFDFDGTLVDTAPDIAYHVNSVLKQFHYPEKSLKEVTRAIGHGVHELMKTLAVGVAEKPEEWVRMVELFRTCYEEKPVIHSRSYPDVAEILDGPLGPFKKVIVTNKLFTLTDKILRELSLRHHFEEIVGDGAGFPPKPDPGSVNYLLKKFSVPAKKAILIGDSRVDMEVAVNSGIDFMWASYGYYDLKDAKISQQALNAKEWKKLTV